MKIYTERNKEADSVEISLNYQEFRKMMISLKKFEDKVSQFKLKNKDKKRFGLYAPALTRLWNNR